MVQICFSADDAAFEIRQLLDTAEAFLTSTSVTLNTSQGYLSATRAEAIANLVWLNVDPRHEEERARFKELRSEARKLMKVYQHDFKLARMPKMDTQPSRPAADIQRVGESRPAFNGNGHTNGHTNGSTKPRRNSHAQKLSDDQVRTIKRFFKNLSRAANHKDDKRLAKDFKVSPALIYAIRVGKQRADVTV